MIEKDNRLIEQLNNIIYMTNVIKNDLETNGKTHYRYMLEKGITEEERAKREKLFESDVKKQLMNN